MEKLIVPRNFFGRLPEAVAWESAKARVRLEEFGHRQITPVSTDPNVKDFYAENSRGNFEYVEAGMIGPVRYYDDPRTTENEALINCHPSARNASGSLCLCN